MRILVAHGPNLNLLGTREPKFYGAVGLNDINKRLMEIASGHDVQIECFQTNNEGDLINKFQAANLAQVHFIIFNPGGWTHTSVALRDTLLAIKIPFIEVHLSNIHARESFRHHSYFSDIASGVITGLGSLGYELALRAAILQMQTTVTEL